MRTKTVISNIATLSMMLVIFLSVGSSGLILFKRYQIRQTVRTLISNLPDNKLVPVEIEYTKGAEFIDEFEVDDDFYDVAKYKIVGDKIIYYCYFDNDETKLTHLSACLLGADSVIHERNELVHLLKVIGVIYIYQQSELSIFRQSMAYCFIDNMVNTQCVFYDISTPPPQLL